MYLDRKSRDAIGEKKFCVRCDKEKRLGQFAMRERKGKIYVNNICTACLGKAQRSRAKLKLFEALGYACNCCGERNPQFLTLQHIERGSNPYGKKWVNGKYVVSKIQSQLYAEAIKSGDRTKYEILCMNCNFAHGQYGECPHRLGLTPEDIIEQLRADVKGVGTKYRRVRDTARKVDDVLKGIAKVSEDV
jgi:hypothetical protein